MQSFEMPINGLHPFFSVNRKKNLEVGGIHHGCLIKHVKKCRNIHCVCEEEKIESIQT